MKQRLCMWCYSWSHCACNHFGRKTKWQHFFTFIKCCNVSVKLTVKAAKTKNIYNGKKLLCDWLYRFNKKSELSGTYSINVRKPNSWPHVNVGCFPTQSNWRIPLGMWCQRIPPILFYSFSSVPCLLCCAQLANEPSYSSCYQFDSPAVSSLLDMDLDSFSTAAKASAVTQVDDLWHEHTDRRDCPLQEVSSFTRDFMFYSERF